MRDNEEPSLRQQLIEARAKIMRQLEIMSGAGSTTYPPDFGPQIAELRNELREIEALLAQRDD